MTCIRAVDDPLLVKISFRPKRRSMEAQRGTYQIGSDMTGSQTHKAARCLHFAIFGFIWKYSVDSSTSAGC